MEKMWKHFKLITKHKWMVFKLSIKAGIPWRGFMHDWSKYSPIEFIESYKCYVGYKSAIIIARETKGYSAAWLHHKGRNKHHEQYWYDWESPIKTTLIPYKYTVELVCDTIAAGKVYKGKEWNNEYPLKYFNEKKDKTLFHPKTLEFLTNIYTQIAEKGIDKTITKKNLRTKYNEIINRM